MRFLRMVRPIKGGKLFVGGPDSIDGLLQVAVGIDANVGNRAVATPRARDLPTRNKDGGGGKGRILGDLIFKGKGSKEVRAGKGLVQVTDDDAVFEYVCGKGFGLGEALGTGETPLDHGFGAGDGFVICPPLDIEVQFVGFVDGLEDGEGGNMPHGQRDTGELEAPLAACFFPATAEKSEQARPISGG